MRVCVSLPTPPMLLCSGLSALNWHLVVHSAVNFSKICFFIHSSCGSWCVVVMCVHSKLMLNMFVVHAGPMDRRGGSFKYRNLDRSVKVATWLIDSQSAQAWNKGEIVKIWKFWNRKNRENSQSVCNCCLLHQCYITLDLLLGLYKTALLINHQSFLRCIGGGLAVIKLTEHLTSPVFKWWWSLTPANA